jgi:penicillin-binding protein 1A
MSGGFSYPLSQLNRATQAVRQPGSAIKPLSYLAALGKGLQPNTLISDGAITFPPIKRGRAKEQDYWSPKNYDGGGGGTLTLRRALENSQSRHRAPAPGRHRGQAGGEPRPPVPARIGSAGLS